MVGGPTMITELITDPFYCSYLGFIFAIWARFRITFFHEFARTGFGSDQLVPFSLPILRFASSVFEKGLSYCGHG